MELFAFTPRKSFGLILAECNPVHPSAATIMRKRSAVRQFQPVQADGVF